MSFVDLTEHTADIERTRNNRYILSGSGRRGRVRDIDRVDAIMLHQTAFVTDNDEMRMRSVIANYVVSQSGTIFYVRGLEQRLNSIGNDKRAIDIEFEGNYINSNGRRGHGSPSLAQIRAGRALIQAITEEMTIRKIYAHLQFTPKNCPGPHLWHNLGMWAMRQFNLSNSGRGARRIPRSWENERFSLFAPCQQTTE